MKGQGAIVTTPVQKVSSSEPPLAQVDKTLESTKPVQGRATSESLPTQPDVTIESSNSKTPLTAIDGLPDDVPLLKENNGDLSTTKNQGMVMYAFTSSLPFDQISEFYKSGMQTNGWKIVNETTQDGNLMWTYTKGDNRVVNIAVSKVDANKTYIALMIIKQ
jgi:hypothetical protein